MHHEFFFETDPSIVGYYYPMKFGKWLWRFSEQDPPSRFLPWMSCINHEMIGFLQIIQVSVPHFTAPVFVSLVNDHWMCRCRERPRDVAAGGPKGWRMKGLVGRVLHTVLSLWFSFFSHKIFSDQWIDIFIDICAILTHKYTILYIYIYVVYKYIYIYLVYIIIYIRSIYIYIYKDR